MPKVPTRWMLARSALPVALFVAGSKALLDLIGVGGVELNPLYTGLVAGNIFLLGFLLAGTLADYKESEKMPGDLVSSMEAIADECLILHRDKRPRVARDCLAQVGAIMTESSAGSKTTPVPSPSSRRSAGSTRSFLSSRA